MKRRISTAALPLLILLITVSCDRSTYFAENRRIDGEKWSMYDPCRFTCKVDDTTAVLNMSISVRTNTGYPYRNIFLFVETTFPSGNSVTDTVEAMLADEKGRWLGKGVGDVREVIIPFRNSFFFPEKGDYHFRVIQGMRDTVLNGVTDLSMRISYKK